MNEHTTLTRDARLIAYARRPGAPAWRAGGGEQ
jgi:hypothetical protein